MYKNYLKRLGLTSAIFSLFFVTGCGTFDLGIVYPNGGQSIAQRDSDMAVCKVKAFEAANSKERQVGNFVAGLTIIGAPLAIEEEKRLQRRIFKECLEEKGYTVEPPKDKKVAESTSYSAENSKEKQTSLGAHSDGKPRITINMGDEWIDSKITENLVNSGAIIYKINHSTDSGLMVLRVKASYIKEPKKYVETSKSALESLLKNPQKSETKIIEINGIQYANYEVWGTLLSNGRNIEIKYGSYVVVDKEEIFTIRFWTLVHNYDFQKSTFEQKIATVSVIDPQRVFSGGTQDQFGLTPNQIKQKCKNLGFVEGSEGYSACVVEILSREK